MKALVAGWFSFEQMGASAGDLMARDLVCEWLDEAGRAYDVALAAPFEGGVDWRASIPTRTRTSSSSADRSATARRSTSCSTASAAAVWSAST